MSTFREAILTRTFTLTAELGLRPGSYANAVLHQASMLSNHVDAIQVSDNAGGRLQMSAVAASAILIQNDIDPVPH